MKIIQNKVFFLFFLMVLIFLSIISLIEIDHRSQRTNYTFEKKYEAVVKEDLNTEKYWINYDGSIRRHEPKTKMSKKERLKQRREEQYALHKKCNPFNNQSS